MSETVGFWTSLVAGGCAGSTVDITLYPLDTIKTRLQAANGFKSAGGFSNIFRGIPAAAAGSFPTNAVFFMTYERSKILFYSWLPQNSTYFSIGLASCAAASIGEVVACTLRVPTENVKQKMQAGQYLSVKSTLKGIKSQGFHKFFTGYSSTVFRDVPFSCIQFPLWEFSKTIVSRYKKKDIEPWEGAMCGALASGISGAITTPIDVVKTRMMLGTDNNGVPYTTMSNTCRRIYVEGGVYNLFSGLAPRTCWLTIGGIVYFGTYEYCKKKMFINF